MRYLLFPFSWVYGIITYLRNVCFDLGLISSYRAPVPVIAVGNLNTGGSGKTPMVEKLIEFLEQEFTIALISRGYGRNTSGFIEVSTDQTPEDCGDEPLQIKRKFRHIHVFVDEKRSRAIAKALELNPNINLILLDDAFQHRRVEADVYVLLTAYDKIFASDHLLPAGNLRESRYGAKRADLMVVTKIPQPLTEIQKDQINRSISKYYDGHIYFSSLEYDELISPFQGAGKLDKNSSMLLVTGIAKPDVLLNYLLPKVEHLKHISFKDHHQFTEKDIQNLLEQYKALPGSDKVLVTTEKDWTRLQKFAAQFEKIKVLMVPVKISMGNEDQHFSKSIYNRITGQ